MYAGRGDLKKILHVLLSRGTAVDLAILVNIGQKLSLSIGRRLHPLMWYVGD